MAQIIDKIKKKNEERAFNKERQKLLSKIITNIGKIVEEEDKITCYVEQKAIDKCKRYEVNDFILKGEFVSDDEIRKKVREINLNKPVYYVFENIEFGLVGLKIHSLFSHIIFKNCVFSNNIMLYADCVTFENNKYYNQFGGSYYREDCFLDADVNKLIFINDNFVNSAEVIKREESVIPQPRFGMNIDAGSIEFINTKVDTDYLLNIKCDDISINDSQINVKELYLDTKSMKSNNSLVIASDGVMIDNTEDIDFLQNIIYPLTYVQAPLKIYNGVELNSENIESDLGQLRCDLIDRLRKIRNYCIQTNDNRINQLREELDNKSISKIYKSN